MQIIIVVIIIVITAVHWWLRSAYYRAKNGSWDEHQNSVHRINCFCLVSLKGYWAFDYACVNSTPGVDGWYCTFGGKLVGKICILYG